MRAIRLLLGVVIVVQGIVVRDWTFALMGGALSIMPLLNIGCCGVSGCNVPASRKSKNTEDITYEEVR